VVAELVVAADGIFVLKMYIEGSKAFLAVAEKACLPGKSVLCLTASCLRGSGGKQLGRGEKCTFDENARRLIEDLFRLSD
jgi:hypothetical protein